MGGGGRGGGDSGSTEHLPCTEPRVILKAEAHAIDFFLNTNLADFT